MAMIRKTFVVEGMHCGACAVSTGMLLQTPAGVRSARADFDAKTAEVEYDDGAIDLAAMNRTLEGLGYRLKEGA
ncbi:heavy-metal-associated domain-containing protein [Aromatoleum toluclasticum]|uniref:heavy-metal-associated domain-containing protein n=1 Tax=Aromatoleum toluclasticum TaxID=92003 RepID=UPI001D193724|nr:heavy-metal-associated domain-containing protein [Aromatoleum toluclasticum]MCC4114919.1 heavy-metal-associated domain-containing protein [Aromatoleum toluclasticum]